MWTDISSGGSLFTAQASPSLAHIVRQTAEAIEHPTDANRTLWDATHDTGTYFGAMGKEAAAALEAAEALKVADSLGVGALGSGSDYTVFLQHLGVRIHCAFVAVGGEMLIWFDRGSRRLLARRLRTYLLDRTRCTTITACSTRRGGRSSMGTLGSSST